MNGRKMKSLVLESSKPTKYGGILSGVNGVGAMNTQAPGENLEADQAVARAREDEMNGEGGERVAGEKNCNQIVRVDGVVEEGQSERPRLEEGFYELEAIRKKRIRQGKVQYLIKWRGWPESSNTWEPRENLSSCPAVITAFERRSRARSGRRSTCGRKRKFSTNLTGTKIEHHSAAAAKVTPQTKTRRKQHSSAPPAMDIIHTAAEDTMRIETRNMRRRSSAAAKDNLPDTKETVLVQPVPFHSLDDSNIENHVNNVCSPKNSGSAGLNRHPLITNGSSLDKSVADSEETQIPGDCIPTEFPKSNIAQSVRSGPRAPAAMDIIHTAAEDTMRIETRNMRRCSSAAANDNVVVKEEIVWVEPVPFPCVDGSNIENHVNKDVCSLKISGRSAGLNGHHLITNGSSLDKAVADSEETQIPGNCIPDAPPGFPMRYCPCVRRKTVGSAGQFKKDSSVDASEDAPDPIRRTTCGSETAFGKDNSEDATITEIVKPTNIQASVNRGVFHVSITFLAKRSDGQEVTVTNDYLKETNPLVLIRFYEANMRFIQSPSV